MSYSLLVALALLMLLLFLRKYRIEVFENNTKVTFIFFNIMLMVLLTTLIVDYKPEYLYIVPICILPLVIKAFFDPRLGLFTHMITVLLLGFVVPNNFEYVFLAIPSSAILQKLACLCGALAWGTVLAQDAGPSAVPSEKNSTEENPPLTKPMEQATVHTRNATESMRRGSWEEAEHQWDLLLKIQPESAAAHANLGLVQLQLKKPYKMFF